MSAAPTGETLRRLRLGLLLATAVALAGTLLAIDAGRQDAEAMRTAVVPAREGLAAARYSLMLAHAKALTSIQVGGPAVGDPGEEYRAAVATTERELAQVSESEVNAGVKQDVQVVESLVATYLGLMEQARAQDTGGSLLAQAYVDYAHDLLHDEILPLLDDLSVAVDATTPGADHRGRVLWWAVPIGCLLALLGVTQVVIGRRFRRVIVLPLLAATVLTVVLGAAARTSAQVGADVAGSRAGLTDLVGGYTANERPLAGSCATPAPVAGGPAEFGGHTCTTPLPQAAIADRDLLVRAKTLTATAQGTADTAADAMAVAAGLALVIALLILLGLQPRIEEYRFRSG